MGSPNRCLCLLVLILTCLAVVAPVVTASIVPKDVCRVCGPNIGSGDHHINFEETTVEITVFSNGSAAWSVSGEPRNTSRYSRVWNDSGFRSDVRNWVNHQLPRSASLDGGMTVSGVNVSFARDSVNTSFRVRGFARLHGDILFVDFFDTDREMYFSTRNSRITVFTPSNYELVNTPKASVVSDGAVTWNSSVSTLPEDTYVVYSRNDGFEQRILAELYKFMDDLHIVVSNLVGLALFLAIFVGLLIPVSLFAWKFRTYDENWRRGHVRMFGYLALLGLALMVVGPVLRKGPFLGTIGFMYVLAALLLTLNRHVFGDGLDDDRVRVSVIALAVLLLLSVPVVNHLDSVATQLFGLDLPYGELLFGMGMAVPAFLVSLAVAGGFHIGHEARHGFPYRGLAIVSTAYFLFMATYIDLSSYNLYAPLVLAAVTVSTVSVILPLAYLGARLPIK